jgi:pyruvate formate lyase activating enzyme
MKEAKYYQKLDDSSLNCVLCPRNCLIKPDCFGVCGVRKNIKGKLFSIVYGRPCAMHVDPIEKKPLYHFLPGSKTFSIATFGCNFFCDFCQNWEISQKRGEILEKDHSFKKLFSPEEIVRLAKLSGSDSISYTYTEPTVFFEYMLDIAKLAKKSGLKNVLVSNGYINEKPLEELCEFINAANIDLKSFNNDFYKNFCKGSLNPVLNSLKILKKHGVWLEITNLVIPKRNDDLKLIEKMCCWISDELGKDVPLHFSAFHPDYKHLDASVTELIILKKIEKIARKYLDNVHLGNIF